MSNKYPKGYPLPDKHWVKGDQGFICYKYTADRVTVVPVTVERRERPHYLSIQVPGLFGGTFGCLCWEHQVYLTKEKAEQMAVELNEELKNRPMEEY